MATNIRLEFISDGFKQILESDGVRELVQETSDNIKNRANANNTRGGQGFESNVIQGNYGGGRWIGFVKSTDRESDIAESEDKALTGAVL